MKKKLLNAKQEAELNSSRSTEQHIDENITVINTIPAILANFNGIKANNAAILDSAEAKGASLTTSSRKGSLKDSLCDETLKFAGVVETFADDTSDLQLRDDMRITLSQLKRMRDDELAPFCRFIYNRALPHANALKDYNLTPAVFTALLTLIDDYAAEAPKPRTAVSQRKTTNANIAALFADNKKRYKKLDKQIETLRPTHPDFVRTYFSNREVANPMTIPKIPKDAANKTNDEPPK
jgi:hypothetical protein